MIKTIEREFLRDHLQKNKKHDTALASDVLPFLTKRTRAIRGQFTGVLGEYIRNISGLKIDHNALKNQEFYMTSTAHGMSEYIANDVDFENDDAKLDFVRFLDAYLFNQEEIKPIHPYLFNYLEVKKELKNEFGKYGQFMNEVFVCDHEEVKAIFNNKDSDDILTELILNNMEGLKDTNNKSDQKKKHYIPLLPSLTEMYRQDLLYLSKYKDYFLSSFPLLTHFYVFMYACQLLIKLEQFTEAKTEEIRPLYFALDWESISKRRKAADDLEGFKYIKEKSSNLFPHIHTLSHLSHNGFNSDQEEKQILLYNDLFELIKEQGSDFEKEFLEELKNWIRDYSEWARINVKDDSEDLAGAFKVLFHCLKEGMSTGVCEKYGGNIEDLGANQFIKNRSSLGQVLNVKHEFFLLLTAVSVKDQRIPLNDLFKEFEKRGIAFDLTSKKEIITLLSNHNILDKKSDSGDAQYVKPIL